MASSFPAMNGGDGTFSYVKNSQLQKESSDFVKAMIHDAIIGKLDADVSGTVCLVDFGCSVGPNTLSAAQNMIEAVLQKNAVSSDGEFQVFFNDRVSNDFNTLFASLPPLRQYYAAAVPGSFHGRLFPRGSITLAHSSFSLHFLSAVPVGVADRGSRAWNGGRILYTCGGGEVEKAYSEQFGRDIKVFLRSRGEEMVKGGLMFLTIPSKGSFSLILNLLESTILDLSNQGIMDKDEIDGFNLAVYFPSEEEARKAIEEDGHFRIEQLEVTNPRTRMSAGAIAMHIRAGLEGIIRQEFEDSLMEKIFDEFSAKAEEDQFMVEASLYNSAQLFYVLKRN